MKSCGSNFGITVFHWKNRQNQTKSGE